MEKKTVIKIWKGRAYLHQEFVAFGLPCEKDTPLGNNPELIKRIRDEFDCDVVFLNDDFTVESSL